MFDLGSLVTAPRGGFGGDRRERLARALDEADAVVIGAGAGLSTAAGLTYAGPRFEAIFGDFIERYRFADMYSGGFHPFGSFEERWAYWSRYIWCNRYVKAPGTAYDDLLSLVGDNDYFVLTTNVDHQFQLAGFDRRRLFYTQGDCGLQQCSQPRHKRTYDNEPLVRDMIEAQGWQISASGALTLPAGTRPAMDVPAELVPHCPVCGRPMAMNLRSDDTFVEDEGWHAAAARYQDFLRRHQRGRVLYLELGVGWNTPVIVKFPFWQAVEKNPRATYACVNLGEAVAPSAIERRSVLVDADIASALRALLAS